MGHVRQATELIRDTGDYQNGEHRKMPTPGFRSSGTLIQDVAQADGRHEIIAVQVNIVPVSSADAGNMDVTVRAAADTFNSYETTMSTAEMIEALRYAADQLEAQQR
jgi:hypothetical protein